jgi:hypothetical protein
MPDNIRRVKARGLPLYDDRVLTRLQYPQTPFCRFQKHSKITLPIKTIAVKDKPIDQNSWTITAKVNDTLDQTYCQNVHGCAAARNGISPPHVPSNRSAVWTTITKPAIRNAATVIAIALKVAIRQRMPSKVRVLPRHAGRVAARYRRRSTTRCQTALSDEATEPLPYAWSN